MWNSSLFSEVQKTYLFKSHHSIKKVHTLQFTYPYISTISLYLFSKNVWERKFNDEIPIPTQHTPLNTNLLPCSVVNQAIAFREFISKQQCWTLTSVFPYTRTHAYIDTDCYMFTTNGYVVIYLWSWPTHNQLLTRSYALRVYSFVFKNVRLLVLNKLIVKIKLEKLALSSNIGTNCHLVAEVLVLNSVTCADGLNVIEYCWWIICVLNNLPACDYLTICDKLWSMLSYVICISYCFSFSFRIVCALVTWWNGSWNMGHLRG